MEKISFHARLLAAINNAQDMHGALDDLLADYEAAGGTWGEFSEGLRVTLKSNDPEDIKAFADMCEARMRGASP